MAILKRLLGRSRAHAEAKVFISFVVLAIIPASLAWWALEEVFPIVDVWAIDELTGGIILLGGVGTWLATAVYGSDWFLEWLYPKEQEVRDSDS